MTLMRTFLVSSTVVALLSAPVALAKGPPSDPGKPADAGKPADPGKPADAGKPDNKGTQNAAAHQANQPGPNAALPAKAKAYGVYCQGESKKHVAGQAGTPFSRCVTAMAKLASSAANSPTAACAALSRKHVAGQRGTPYSLCVAGAAKLLNDSEQD
jgi:hypothetical protein